GVRLTVEKTRDLPRLDPIDVILRRVGESLVPELSVRREGDLTPSQLVMLKALAQSDGPLKATAWEHLTGMVHSSFYRVRPELMKLGMVDGTPRVGYSITESGRSAILNSPKSHVSPTQSHGTGSISPTVPRSLDLGLGLDQTGGTETNGMSPWEDDPAIQERLGLQEGR
ncbi:MAG: hypothetical protein ACT4P7_01175, partial [Gemmatimonadaceae bacterium]